MPNNLKLGIGLLVVTSIFFLCVSLGLFFIKESEREKRISLEVELQEILSAKNDLQKGLDELRLINSDLESKLGDAEEKARLLNEKLAKEKETRDSISVDLQNEKQELKKLRDQIMLSKEEKVSLVQKVAQTESEYQRLKDQLNLILEAKETLEKRVKEIISQKGVELEKIVIQSGAPEPTYPPARETPALTAKENKTFETAGASFAQEETRSEPEETNGGPEVLIVNKRFGFIIVNAGEADGLRKGNRLDIFRNEQFLAQAEIEKLYDRMSAAAVLSRYKDVNIKPGDQVVIPEQ